MGEDGGMPVLVDAPARVVSAALLEVRTLREALARSGVTLDGSGGVLAPGDEVRFSGAMSGVLRLVDAESGGVRALLGTAEFLARCEAVPGGTLLTCGFSGGGDLTESVSRTLEKIVAARAPRLAGATVVVGAAIVRDGRLLAQQRAYPAEAAGRWELAGGRVEPGETDAQAVRRECEEELGVLVEPGDPVGPDVVLGDGKLLLRVYSAELADGTEPTAREHRGVRWLGAEELDTVDWLPADRVLLPALHRRVRDRSPRGGAPR
jgi:8-oxo-dGTP diphosphatase